MPAAAILCLATVAPAPEWLVKRAEAGPGVKA
ncbi:protein of unknown function [Methylorubrum extorquens]|uniref:Uncharacterized protein n=1 Tax=Methylorubrum extorquens TaxID=408 RepID=A0A2N9AVV9_METEX|nr:protein of unknown function [Methylorubrum extorquens]